MKLFENIRRNSGLSALRKQAKELKRSKLVHNLTTARRVGIVTYINNLKDFDEVFNLLNFFGGLHIQVCILGYYPGKEIPQQLLMRKGTNIFCKKETNWYGKPITPVVDEFCNTEFDILLDLTLDEVFPIRWVSSMSRSRFRVGALSYEGNPFDLIINIEKSKGIAYLIEQTKYYLNLLNNRHAQAEALALDTQTTI